MILLILLLWNNFNRTLPNKFFTTPSQNRNIPGTIYSQSKNIVSHKNDAKRALRWTLKENAAVMAIPKLYKLCEGAVMSVREICMRRHLSSQLELECTKGAYIESAYSLALVMMNLIAAIQGIKDKMYGVANLVDFFFV